MGRRRGGREGERENETKCGAPPASTSPFLTSQTTTTTRHRLRGAAALAAPLKCQLVTGVPQTATPVPHAPRRKAKGDGTKICAPAAAQRAVLVTTATRAAVARSRQPVHLGVDPHTGLALRTPRDAWADAEAARALAARVAKARAPAWRTPIPAVEVAHAGVAYNPDPAYHQDALAAAVATELAKEAAHDAALRAAPPRFVEAGSSPAADNELDGLLVDGVATDDDSEEEAGDAYATAPATPLRQPRRKTTADRNRTARVRAAAADMAARRIAKRAEVDMKRLPRLAAELDKEAAAARARAARRAADAADRARRLPPKLGRRNYVDPPSAVLCSDEVPTSLRALRPDAGLARDRFTSLQKRGLVEPRLPAPAKKKARVSYAAGGRADRAAERQDGVDRLRAANVKRKARR